MRFKLILCVLILSVWQVQAQRKNTGSIVFKPHIELSSGHFILRNQESKFGRKFLHAQGLVLGQDALTLGLLYALPGQFTNWKTEPLSLVRIRYQEAFTKPPVIDKDSWTINYVGHAYQGMMYYNALRAQGAPIWQSGIFCLANSMLWEYCIESHKERPSVQDIFYTPFAGAVLGEFSHMATIAMARNGFKWYEAALVCVINPMFAIQNGFKWAKPSIR